MRLGISRNVWAMSWTSLLNDAASELLYPVLPLFLIGPLAAPAAAVGAVEGAAAAASQLFGVIVGRRSDRIRRRLPFVWLGYTLSNISKPLIAVAPAWGWVLGARVLDRTGKGIRTAPRDALLRDSSDPARTGATFGFHRFMDSLGAVIGPLLALVLLASGLSLRQVILITIVPAALTMVALLRVRESAPRAAAGRVPAGRIGALPARFWAFTIAWTVFSLGNSADVFLLLRAHSLGLGATAVVLAYALYNVLYSGLSWPLGHISDRIGKRRVLAGGLVVFAGVYAGFGLASSTALVWPLMAVYGCYMAATDGVGKAYVSDVSPLEDRATGQGVFRLATGAAETLASLAAGVLWQEVGPGAVFALGAGTAVLGLAALGAAYAAGSGTGSVPASA
ncbi:MAG: MFS transporter [Gaiellales bacterium]